MSPQIGTGDVETRDRGLIVTTAVQVDQRPIREYLGIVSGEAIAQVSPSSGKSSTIISKLRRKSTVLDKQVNDARERAVAEMTARAVDLGATAVVGVDIDVAKVHDSPDGGMILIVSAVGTAVTI